MMFGVRSDDCIKMHRTTSWTWPAAEVLPLWSCWNRSLACGPSSCLAMQSLQTALLPGRLTKPAVQVTVQRLAFIACLIVCLVRLCLGLLTGTSQYCMPLLQPQCQVFNPADTIMQSCIFGSTADAEAIFICCGAASNDNLPGHYVALAAQSADNCGSWYAAACKPALCTCLSCLC